MSSTCLPSIEKAWKKYYPTERVSDVKGGLYDYLCARNSNNMELMALKYFGREFSYEDFIKRIDELALFYSSKGIKPKDNVVILGLCTPDIIASVYALNKIGAVACLEYVTQSENNLESAVKLYESKYALVLDMFYAKYKDSLQAGGVKEIFTTSISDYMPFPVNVIVKLKNKVNCPKEGHLLKSKAKGKVEPYKWDEKDTAIMLSTSGTTGLPKRAELSNYAINSLAYQAPFFDVRLTKGSTMLTPTPPFLAYGISLTTHMPLCNGVGIILVPNPDAKFAAEHFLKYKPNFFITGSAFLDQIKILNEKKKEDLSFITAIEIGGHKVLPEYIDEMQAFIEKYNSTGKILTGYGMTELAGCSTGQTFSAGKNTDVGIPLIDVNVKVVDETTGEELPYGKTGELMVNSPCMMNRYFKNPDETKKIFDIDENGVKWIHTGDLATIDEDGCIAIVGRIKRLAVTLDTTSGTLLKLYPDYVESLIEAYPGIDACGVITVEDVERRNVAIAFIKSSVGKIESTILDDYLSSKTESYNIPVKYVFVDTIPVLPNGKKDYRSLQALL